MGTNYYHTVKTNECAACGRHDGEPVHIGKSSAGWCFSLHVMPDEGICDLDDWRKRWEAGGEIRDEYGEVVTTEEMLRIITERGPGPEKVPTGYESWADFHRSNRSTHGPNGMLRHGHRSTPGAGTWDLCPYSFS